MLILSKLYAGLSDVIFLLLQAGFTGKQYLMKGWGTRYLLMSTLGISTDLGHGEVGLDLERGPTTVQAPVTTSADPMESSRVKISHPECSPGMQLKR